MRRAILIKRWDGWKLALLLPVIGLGSIFYFDTYWIYIALLFWVLTSGVSLFVENPLQRVSVKAITDFAPLAMLIAWFYGVIFGLLSGVNLEFIFRNYFGMVLYALYPTVLLCFKTQRDVMGFIWNCAVISGLILTVVIAIDIFNLMINPDAYFFKSLVFEEIGVPAFRLHYSANSFFLLAAIALAHKFIRNEEGLSKFWASCISLWLIALYLASVSKGFFLAFILFIVILMVRTKKKIIFTSISLAFLSVSIFLVIGTQFIDSNIDFERILLGDELSDSSARSIQSKELIEDISFLGHGLGASLANSSYVRDSNYGYSFELTYLNLIHKLGVFSVLVFMAFALTLIKGGKMLLSGYSGTSLSGAVVLTLMLYLIVSWGNPIMFNPICVISHMLALALINKTQKI